RMPSTRKPIRESSSISSTGSFGSGSRGRISGKVKVGSRKRGAGAGTGAASSKAGAAKRFCFLRSHQASAATKAVPTINKIQRYRGQGFLTARKQVDRAVTLTRRTGHHRDTGRQDVLAHELEIGVAAAEKTWKFLLEPGIDALEGLLEARAGLLVDALHGLLE